MYPPNPISDHPDRQDDKWPPEGEPNATTETLWLLVAFVVAVAGIATFVSV